MTCEPFWAETMISHLPIFLDAINSSNRMLATKLLRNMSKWTYDLQRCIGLAFKVSDDGPLTAMTNEPQKYLGFINGCTEGDRGGDPYAKYRSLHHWKDAVPSLMSSFSTEDDNDLLVEIIGTLVHLTANDLPSLTSWDDLITDYSLIDLMRNLITTRADSTDICLEVILLCSTLCESRLSANLLAESTLIHELLFVWEEVGGDFEIHLQILNLCEKLLYFEETRSTLLLGTGASLFAYYTFVDLLNLCSHIFLHIRCNALHF